MNKALLIGNGFTLNLNNEYSNSRMMEKFRKRIPNLINRAEEEFKLYRNCSFTLSDLYNVSEALFCGNDLLCGGNLYTSSDRIYISEAAKSWVIEKLSIQGFNDPELIFTEYFENYGLIYSINKDEILGVETYLKVISLFKEIGKFNENEYAEIKIVAYEVYYNEGKHGKSSIRNNEIDVGKLASTLSEYVDIYTTNYDTILDDFLEEQNRFPFHLHGGFSTNHRNKDPDGRYDPKNARLIWGINAEQKFEELKVGFDFGDIDYSAFRYGQSRLADYFDFLKERQYDEIHILGYSGENDAHINQRIKENAHIKNIILFVDPTIITDLETQVRSRILYGGDNKPVNIKSWNDFWDPIKK
ncbi:MAG: hypothetical protein P0Y55_12865 [Candidatus Cohnella colombiensis]|uniref:Uncharacterized protein n=1 Tax=Candidatus Cohnella colombiensis TaxID=3121368 RepID=A0AA95JEN9_9BACL|nr:MAG: hypothetical protein P0Y55_12865 [Cohnella sp.]